MNLMAKTLRLQSQRPNFKINRWFKKDKINNEGSWEDIVKSKAISIFKGASQIILVQT